MIFLRWLFTLSIRLKISFAIFLLIITLIGSILLVVKHEFKINSYNLSQHSAQNLIDSNKDSIIKLVLEDDYWQIYKFLSSIAKLDFINSAGLIDQYGNVIAHTNPLKYPIGSSYTFSKKDDIQLPLIQSKMNFGTFVFETNKEYTQPYYNTIKKKLYIFIFIATLISIFLGYILSTRILKRLEILSRNAKKIQDNQWNDLEFIHTLENDEITNIVQSIEKMIKTVQNMITHEKDMKKFYHKIIEHIDKLIIIYEANGDISYHNKDALSKTIIQDNSFHQDFKVHIDVMKNDNLDSCIIAWELTHAYLLISRTRLDEKRFALTISDISELKKSEEQRQMTNSFKLINDLSAMLIHEIKNMLQPLKLLLFHGDPGKEELDRADKIIQKIDNIVFDILHPCKPIDYTTEESVEINKYVDEVLFFLSSLLQEKNINIKLEIENDIKPFIHEEDLKKILLNLLSNSIEASEKYKNIIIQWGKINSTYGCLTIIDEGHGIDVKIQEEIKKPFFTTKEHGSGIGLFSVYKITYLYKGYIELDSKPGKTEFKIYLPINRRIL